MSSTPSTPKKHAEFDQRRRDLFLRSFRLWCNVSAACKAAGIDRSTAYNARKSDPEFAQAWEDAKEDAVESLEKAALKRARDGVRREKGIYFMGTHIATEVETHYSDTLTIFLLKAHKPDMYREPVQRFAQTDADGNNITDEERAARIAAIFDGARARRDGRATATAEKLDTAQGAAE